MNNIKKIIMLTILLVFSGLGSVFASDGTVEMRMNGQIINSDVSPVIIDGTTLVPVSLISRVMGYEVQWDQDQESVTISNSVNQIVIYLNSSTAYVNGTAVALAVPAQSINDRTMVPLRFIAESIGLKVEWDEANQLVNIYNTAQKMDGKTAREFLESLSDYTSTFNTFKFMATVDCRGILNSQGNQKTKQFSSTIVNAVYKDKQYYTSTAYTSPKGTTNIEMFFNPPKAYLKEADNNWEELNMDAFGKTLGGLIANMNSFNNLSVKERVKLLSSDTKIVYGNDEVIDGMPYRVVMIDSKGPDSKKLVEALVSIEDYYPQGVPENVQENYELIEYDYINKSTGNIERRKMVSTLNLWDTKDPETVVTLITEQNFKLFDFGVPVTFPDQPNKTNTKTAKDTIKIGLNLELTGAVAFYGQKGENGALLAIEDINKKGGILGKQVEALVLDNKSDNSEAADVATRLAQSGIVGYVGCMTSGRTLSAIPVATQYKIPIISPTATNTNVTVDTDTGKAKDYVFRVCFLDPLQGSVMAEFAILGLKAKSAVLLVDNSNDYSKGLATSFKKEFTAAGGKIVGEEFYVEKDKDFKATLAKIKAINPDVIYVPGYYNEAGLIILQARELGITAPILGGDGWNSPTLLAIAGSENLGNCFYCNHFTTANTDPITHDFVQEYKARYGSEPDTFAALGYDAALCMMDAVRRAGSTDTVKIAQALAATSNLKGVTGTITMDKNHNPIKPVFIIGFDHGNEYLRATMTPKS